MYRSLRNQSMFSLIWQYATAEFILGSAECGNHTRDHVGIGLVSDGSFHLCKSPPRQLHRTPHGYLKWDLMHCLQV